MKLESAARKSLQKTPSGASADSPTQLSILRSSDRSKEGALMRADEERIYERLTRRDEQGLRDLLRAYGGAVLETLLRRFRGRLDRDECEEALTLAAHDVWLNIADKFDPSHPGASLRNWFAGNAIIQAMRLFAERKRPLNIRGPYDESAAAERDALADELHELIAGLPSPQDRILSEWLQCNGRPNYCALAKSLGLSVTMTWKLAQRAKESLRAQLVQSAAQSCDAAIGSKIHDR